jgi:hypothetical protein
MRNHSTVVHNGISIVGDIGLVPVVHHSLIAVLLIVGTTVVRAIVNDRKFLAVLAHPRRAFCWELELYPLGFVERVCVGVFGLCNGDFADEKGFLRYKEL